MYHCGTAGQKNARSFKPMDPKPALTFEMNPFRRFLLIEILLTAAIYSFAQSPIESADSFLKDKQWAKAEAAYRQITDRYASNAAGRGLSIP